MKSDQYGDKGSRKVKRDRYWSVMLVGDHGRIIPFRHFKGMIIGGICLLVTSIVALGVLGALYARQKHVVAQLKSEVRTVKRQVSELRDEKDLYLTQLIARQERQSGPGKKKAVEKKDKAPPAPKKGATRRPTKAVPTVKPAPPKPKAVPVKWAADIRRFKVTYQPNRKVLKAQFRIYNTSKPKKTISGRTVVVFKNLDDTPIHWFPVPRVQLRNGEPSGSQGQSYKINNYRTEVFRAYGQKAPVKFNSATVYVYTKDGQMLASKDFGFNIDYKPPAQLDKQVPAAKVKTAPPATPATSPAVKQRTEVPAQSPAIEAPEALKEPSTHVAPPSADAGAKPSDKISTSRDDPPSGADSQPPTGVTPGTEPPANSDLSADTPETDLKSKTRGEQQ